MGVYQSLADQLSLLFSDQPTSSRRSTCPIPNVTRVPLGEYLGLLGIRCQVSFNFELWESGPVSQSDTGCLRRRHAPPETLDKNDKDVIITFMIVFLSPNYVNNPFLKAKFMSVS